MRAVFVSLVYALICLPVFCQDGIETQLKSADSYIESGFYELARNLLIEVKKDLAPGSEDYVYCADKIAQTYSQQWEEAMNSPSTQKKLTFLQSYLAHIQQDQAHLHASYRTEIKHKIYEALLGQHLENGDSEAAHMYRGKLYYGFQNGLLPKEMKEHFSLGRFSNGSVIIWGNEYFEGYAAPQDQGSFSKVVYSVYPANSSTQDEQELMQFHLKKVNWIDNNLAEYLLVQRPGSSQRGAVVTLWDYSFNDPLDYVKLREVILTLAMRGDTRQ